ncbi:hypothetical protein BHE74_00021787 [Ensete ventricosum]|nr:hypothetical protein BHE74_00021787 [Ensete ventricosum]
MHLSQCRRRKRGQSEASVSSTMRKEDEEESSEASALGLRCLNPHTVISSGGIVDLRKGLWGMTRERLQASSVKRHAYFELSSFSQCANEVYTLTTIEWLSIYFRISFAHDMRGFDRTTRIDRCTK